jgi:hypothetical protein
MVYYYQIDTQFKDVTHTLVSGLLLGTNPSAKVLCYYPEENVEYFFRICDDNSKKVKYIPVDLLIVGYQYYVKI